VVVDVDYVVCGVCVISILCIVFEWLLISLLMLRLSRWCILLVVLMV